MKKERKWKVYAKKADFFGLGERLGVSPLTVRLLRNRDLTEEDQMREALSTDSESWDSWEKIREKLNSPWQMDDMEKACEVIRGTLEKGEKIRIIGDYDIDGICSIFILFRVLKALGADVDWDIPDRVKDGYGLNESFVLNAIADGVKLMITCDNGISAKEAIGLAKDGGMKVVVTDHHEVPKEERDGETREIIPPADAVVDPKKKACQYPFPGICGAVVAWKVMSALTESMHREDLNGLLYDLTLYAGIATVGDVMELKGENRILVKKALAMLRECRDVGLCAMMNAQGMDKTRAKCYHIGFIIGPMMNAGGRLDTAKRVVELLLCQDAAVALADAEALKSLNDERKLMTEKAVADAAAMLEENGKDDDVYVIFLPECHESIAGIVAGRIREFYNHPTIVLTLDAQGNAKGSGRSIPGYSMFDKLSECKELLTKFGGHPMAAGLSLEKENIEEFRRRLNAASGLTQDDFVPEEWIDFELPLGYLSEEWIREMDILEPFGMGNPKPQFGLRNVKVRKATVLGKERKILKMSVICPDEMNGITMDAVFFGNYEEFLDYYREKFSPEDVNRMLLGNPNNITMSLIYCPQINEFRGNRSIQLEIRDYK